MREVSWMIATDVYGGSILLETSPLAKAVYRILYVRLHWYKPDSPCCLQGKFACVRQVIYNDWIHVGKAPCAKHPFVSN